MTKEEGMVTKDNSTTINNVDPNGSIERVGNKGDMILEVGGNVEVAWLGRNCRSDDVLATMTMGTMNTTIKYYVEAAKQWGLQWGGDEEVDVFSLVSLIALIVSSSAAVREHQRDERNESSKHDDLGD